ncbi:F-box only protein 50 [Gopherus flavomarginatus]|uniref:F-box only protein 50 n=1 Tax=Gopherus flavomarginatus TaxID=286002 RepID=UPI0021CBF167|nr:F-box only protein 50 [Gopherus flavomarginatus]
MASQQLRAQTLPLSPGAQERSWQQQFEGAWELGRRGVPLPRNPDWKALCERKPFERNLLQSPNPEGVNISEPAPRQPPNSPRGSLESLGDFSGWAISTEELPPPVSSTKPISAAPRFSWCVKQQRVDLLAEGLWEELLDSYQPNITVMDWYEDSQLAESVYQLHVRLLAADGQTPLREFHHQGPEHGASQEKKNWCHVSHVFHGYGPGVRYVHFQHQTLDAETPGGLRRTRATDSSVSVQLRD